MEKRLGQLVFESTSNGVKSKYKFPREEPTKADWIRWGKFWTSYGTGGRRLQEELGNWKNPTHRKWRWFYNKKQRSSTELRGIKYIIRWREEAEQDSR